MLLLDHASGVKQILCPGEELVISEIETENTLDKSPVDVNAPPKPSAQSKSNSGNRRKSAAQEVDNSVKETSENELRILKDLDKDKIVEGQIIKIEQLYFDADSSNFTSGSFYVLDEIYNFLVSNPHIVIEIGGHTNGVPGKQYCQTLSLKRARAVAGYLYQKGILDSRIIYKGYGKERPIASNRTIIGRQKNQRVEIKILKVK